MASSRFIDQLFDFNLSNVVNVDCSQPNYKNIIIQQLVGFITQGVTPSLYLYDIKYFYFNRVIKGFLKAHNFTTLGVEKIPKKVVSEVLHDLPKSVNTIGINNLSSESMQVAYEMIKLRKTSGQNIAVICGAQMDEMNRTRFYYLNNSPVATSLTILHSDVPVVPVTAIIVDEGVKGNKGKRMKLEFAPPVKEEKVADVICRLIKKNTALELDNAVWQAKASAAEYKLETLCGEYNAAMAKIRMLEGKFPDPNIQQLFQLSQHPFPVRPLWLEPVIQSSVPSNELTSAAPSVSSYTSNSSSSSSSSNSSSSSSWNPQMFAHPASIPQQYSSVTEYDLVEGEELDPNKMLSLSQYN
jgi:hypothetical protein